MYVAYRFRLGIALSIPNLRYFDWDGRVHLTKGKTGGQEGDPLEMFIFNLTIHHHWGLVFRV